MLPSALEVVIFDVGGTLVHVDYAFISETAAAQGTTVTALRLQRGEAAARHAIDAHARTTGSVRGTDASRFRGYFTNLLVDAGVPRDAVDPILAALEREHAERSLWRHPFDSAARTLRRLCDLGVRTAVVSNADGRAEDVLSALDLTTHLDLIVDSHHEGVEKPDPEIFRRALGRLGVEARRAVYVGDIYSIDALGARAAGIHPVIVDPTGTYRELDCPVITDLSELLTPLERVESTRGGA